MRIPLYFESMDGGKDDEGGPVGESRRNDDITWNDEEKQAISISRRHKWSIRGPLHETLTFYSQQ